MVRKEAVQVERSGTVKVSINFLQSTLPTPSDDERIFLLCMLYVMAAMEPYNLL